jgi:AcrR family transcriptional regulator
MPRLTAERLQDRRESIIAAARDVFTRTGFAQSSVSDIAQAAGVSDGLLYRYFPNKQELLFEVLGEFYTKVITGTEQAIEIANDFESKLLALVQQHLQTFARDTDLCRLFIAEVRNFEDYVGSRIQQLNRRYASIFLRVFAAGVEQGIVSADIDLRLLRDILLGGIEHWAWRHISMDLPMDVRGTASMICNLLLGGVRGDRRD